VTVAELEAKVQALKFDRRDAVLSVVGDLRKQVEANLCLDRIATIADEATGPHPVQSAEESLTRIERELFDLRWEREQLKTKLAAAIALLDEVHELLAMECGDPVEWSEEFDSKWYARRKALDG
jgi:hypothetical protein